MQRAAGRQRLGGRSPARAHELRPGPPAAWRSPSGLRPPPAPRPPAPARARRGGGRQAARGSGRRPVARSRATQGPAPGIAARVGCAAGPRRLRPAPGSVLASMSAGSRSRSAISMSSVSACRGRVGGGGGGSMQGGGRAGRPCQPGAGPGATRAQGGRLGGGAEGGRLSWRGARAPTPASGVAPPRPGPPPASAPAAPRRRRHCPGASSHPPRRPAGARPPPAARRWPGGGEGGGGGHAGRFAGLQPRRGARSNAGCSAGSRRAGIGPTHQTQCPADHSRAAHRQTPRPLPQPPTLSSSSLPSSLPLPSFRTSGSSPSFTAAACMRQWMAMVCTTWAGRGRGAAGSGTGRGKGAPGQAFSLSDPNRHSTRAVGPWRR